MDKIELEFALVGGKHLVVSISQILFFKAEGQLTELYYLDKDGLIVSRFINLGIGKVNQLTVVHEVLFRCHRSYIINLTKILDYGIYPGKSVQEIFTKTFIPIARRKRLEFHNSYRRSQ